MDKYVHRRISVYIYIYIYIINDYFLNKCYDANCLIDICGKVYNMEKTDEMPPSPLGRYRKGGGGDSALSQGIQSCMCGCTSKD